MGINNRCGLYYACIIRQFNFHIAHKYFVYHFLESFRGNVCKTLMENVKTGNTISYGKLAQLVNNKG